MIRSSGSSVIAYDWLQPKDRRLTVALESEKKEAEEFNAPLKVRMERLEKSLEEKEG